MGHERWFRGQHDGQGRPIDWLTLARQHGVPWQQAQALYERAVQQARDVGEVQGIYLGLLAAARRDIARPSPGKVTRTMRAQADRAGQKRHARASRLTGQPIAPGHVTLTSFLGRPAPGSHGRDRSRAIADARTHLAPRGEAAERSAPTPYTMDEFERTLDALLGRDTAPPQEPWASEHAVSEAWPEAGGAEPWASVEAAGRSWTSEASEHAWAADEEPWLDEQVDSDHEVEHLPAAVLARMERAFGQDFDDVVIHPDSPEATGATRALTRGNEIHFRAGAYQPGTAAGDWLIAHELAHVVQQTARPGQSAGRRALESEADRAASALLAGRSAAVSLGASMGAALAFSDSEDHDLDAEQDAAASSAPAADAAASSASAADAAVQAPETDADSASEVEADDGNDAALLAEIRSPVAAEGGTGGAGGAGGGGGGGEPVPVAAEAPQVAGAPPEQGLAALQGVRPDHVASALGDVRASASSEVSEERAALAQDPPQQMSTGEAAAAPVPGAGPAGAANAEGADAGRVQARAGNAAGENGQPVQGQIANADTSVPASAPPPPVAATRAPAIDNAPQDTDNAGGGISEADAERMSEAIARLPVTDPHANTDPGPAPELAMTEDARASAQADRDALEATVTGAEATAATDIAQPMGEDHIEVTLAPETLKAQLAGDAAAAAGAAVADAGQALGAARTEAFGDAGEGVAIVAQLEKGADIDAALAEAQGQVAVEREAHAQRALEERARADEEIAALKTQTEADQAQARTDARAQVDQARADWQAEVDAETEAARTEADGEIEAGLADVEAEQTRANSEAEQHIDQGRQDAEDEQKKGEEEAERVKKEKEDESSGGFFGWLASRAKAFFEGIKQAISSLLDAARKAIKRVIEAAKKLAVQVIEAARKVITATIKAVGKALIAIGDRLLAAFPALRERFRETIQGLVDDAVAAVDALAESLKENVQKALDLLGQGLDAALGLLEQGLHALVDGVAAVVDGAISFAKGVVEALGAFAVLIKDVASDPGGWLGKLGSAVVDGIQNHLWGALQTAVLAWFQSKVLELLGIGGLIVELLMEGGIDMGQITSMAWEALQTAIPIALVTILVEKLVSMIVPAAGAVLAIIEGLYAAWGTVSRIIAAMGAFVAFLQAVKGGAAGPLFANLLAAAAVVVLDFVANWLLRKLASAARKVGAKLKQLAERFKRRRQARRKGKGKDGHDGRRNAQDGHDGTTSGRPRRGRDHETSTTDRRANPRAGDKKSRKEDEQRKRADAEARLERAKRAVRLYLKRPHRKSELTRYLAHLKRVHRLRRLDLQITGRRAAIHGEINPKFTDYADAEKTVVVENAELNQQAEQEGLVTFFRSMSLVELKKIVEKKRLTTKVDAKGKASSEMMIAEQNYFDGNEDIDVGKGYSVDLIERPKNKKTKKGWDYAVLVKIEVLASAKTDVLLNPTNARLHSDSTSGNEDVLRRSGIDPTQINTPVTSGEFGVVMLKVESNRGTAVQVTGGHEKQKVVNYSIRPNDPDGLLDGDPLAEFNKRIVRITVVGGGISRKEITFI